MIVRSAIHTLVTACCTVKGEGCWGWVAATVAALETEGYGAARLDGTIPIAGDIGSGGSGARLSEGGIPTAANGLAGGIIPD